MKKNKQYNLDMTPPSHPDALVEIKDFSLEYHSGATVGKAINGLNLVIKPGDSIGIVGESGAGKTSTALSIMNLLPDRVSYITGGNIYYRGKSVFEYTDKEMDQIRGKGLSMVFANPLSSLNPLYSVGHQIAMGILAHEKVSKEEANERAAKLLETVGIARYRLDDLPHQFSGGMRQRVGIAAALACNPDLLICDEPTTALDVTIQAQILELMKKLQTEFSTALVMITHNLGIIAELCNEVAVMYGGEIVEYGSVKEVFTNPKHWYTHGLINAIPNLSGPRDTLQYIPGVVANAKNLPEGCKFHPRCSHCTEKCKTEAPKLISVGENHQAACWVMEG